MRHTLPLVVAATLLATPGCGGDRHGTTVPEQLSGAGAAALAVPEGAVAVPFRTYDGSGQTVHPDFAAPPAPWRHRYFYLALTPYPAGNQHFENPSLYASLDGMRWSGAPGAPQPLARPRRGHLSDPDLVYAMRRGELFLYYREASDSDRVFVVRSGDGSAWSAPQQVVVAPRTAALSPAIVRRAAGDWWMWSVDARPGCQGAGTTVELRRSSDGIAWSAPQRVRLEAVSGHTAWHIDAQWVEARGEFWAMFPVKAAGTCATTALMVATSRDGVAWEVRPEPVVTAGTILALNDIVYRATFAYEEPLDRVTIWVSGARLLESGLHWSTVALQRPRRLVFGDAPRGALVGVPRARAAVARALATPP